MIMMISLTYRDWLEVVIGIALCALAALLFIAWMRADIYNALLRRRTEALAP